MSNAADSGEPIMSHDSAPGLVERLYASRFYAPLNDEQRAAADSGQQLIVVSAGAGTGKTQTLVARYLRLLLERADQPQPAPASPPPQRPYDHLLAITYTNAAADEMRRRVEDALRELGLTALARQMNGAWITTFHGFCVRVLKRWAFEVGVDPAFMVLDDDERLRLRRQSFEATIAHFYQTHASSLLHLLGFYSQAQLRSACFTLADEAAKRALALANLALEGFLPEEVAAGCPDPACVRTLLDFAVAWQERYAQLKQQRGAYDYDDLILTCRDAFEIPAIRAYYRAQFTEVMLDEAQDSNSVQLLLLERIAARRTVVGDFKQSIYRFQGANVGVFNRLVKRAQDPGDAASAYFTLRRNYRSRGEILDYINALFSTPSLLSDQLTTLEVGGERQWLSAQESARFPAPVLAAGITATPPETSATQEAIWIAEQLAAIAGRSKSAPAFCYQPQDLVVLVAKRRFGQAIAAALAQRGLASQIIGEDDFFEQPIICDARALLAALRNPADDTAFLQLLLSSLGRVSDRGLYELACAAAAPGAPGPAPAPTPAPAAPRRSLTLWEAANDPTRAALSDPADAENLRQTLALLGDAFMRLGATPLSELIMAAFHQRGADAYYQSADPARAAQSLADLRHLCHMADGIQAEGGGLVDLIVYLDDKEAYGGATDAPLVSTAASDVVRIMTIHAAKGLQFPVVAVACAQDGADPATPRAQVFVCREEGEEASRFNLGLKYTPSGTQDTLSTPAAARAIAEDKEAESFEKVRQLYVACTRAEQVLLLSYSADAGKGVSGKLVQAVASAEEESGKLVQVVASAAEEEAARLAPDGRPTSAAPHAPQKAQTP